MHIIKKQVIELKLARRQDAFRMQHLISEHYRNEMIPVLESVFNDYCSEDEVLIFDRLEIDFGVITEKDIERNRWDDSMLARFKSSLLENLTALSVNKTFIRRSKAMNSCRQWMAYMQKGYLPWNAITVTDEWYDDVLETLATDYSGVAILRKLILTDKTFAYRIALQHDAVFLTKLVEVITAQNHKRLSLAAEEIFTIIKRAKIYQHQQAPNVDFVKAIWQQFLVIAAGAEKNLSTESIAGGVLQNYASILPVQKKQQKELLSLVNLLKQVVAVFFESKNSRRKNSMLADKDAIEQKSETDTSGKTSKKKLRIYDDDAPEVPESKTSVSNKEDVKVADQNRTTQPLESQDTGKERAASDALLPGRTQNSENQLDDKHNMHPDVFKDLQQPEINPLVPAENMMEKKLSKISLDEKQKEKPGKLLTEIIPPEGIFIQHAGVILVHPFLGSLLRRLQWLENKEFINNEVQIKAVFMLHFLATGETVAAEYELVICKLLCAYPLNEPLPVETIFSEPELQEATDMLTALIQQWDKLKNTSIGGLREGFLQRSGKLFLKNDLPFVQVESSAIDVLLDFLPWNISMIKLPWMKEILRAEWR